MEPQSEAKSSSRTWTYVLFGIVGFLILVVAFAIGGRARESARRSQVIPGAAVMYSSAEGPYGQVDEMAYKAGGGMGGGRAGGRMAEQPAEMAPGAGFEVRLASAIRSGPMLIRTGNMRVRVEDVAKAHGEVARIVREAKGYVASSSISSEEGPTYATITVRLPAAGLDSVIDRVAALGKLLQKQISTEEVTEEYVDLTSRKRNLEREEGRLLDLLERAGKVKDLLEVEQTLARVRGEIETIAGRMRYLENRVALSTLTIELLGPQPEPTAGGPVWAARDVWREAVRSLLTTGRGLASLAIWVAVFTPVWLPISLLLIWLFRRALLPTEQTTSAGK